MKQRLHRTFISLVGIVVWTQQIGLINPISLYHYSVDCHPFNHQPF